MEKNWPLACPHPLNPRWSRGAFSCLLIPREAGMRKSGGGLQAWPAWRPSQLRESNLADSGMLKPIKGRRLNLRPPVVVHADSQSTPARPQTQPCSSHAHTDTHPRQTHAQWALLSLSHPPPPPRTLANSTAVRGAGFLGSAEPWAPQPREGTLRRAEGGYRRGSLTNLGGIAAYELRACQ